MYDPYEYDKEYDKESDNEDRIAQSDEVREIKEEKKEETEDHSFRYYNQYGADPAPSRHDAGKKSESKKAAGKKAEKSTGKKWGLAAAYGCVFGVIAAGAFMITNFAGTKLEERFFPTRTQAVEQTPLLSGTTSTIKEVDRVNEGIIQTAKEWDGKPVNVIYDVTEVAENVMPSIVSITNKSVQEVLSMYYGRMKYESESAGSGIILGENNDELLIMTNNHVVEGSKELTVGFIDEEVCPATVKGTDQADDLAVIAVKLVTGGSGHQANCHAPEEILF